MGYRVIWGSNSAKYLSKMLNFKTASISSYLQKDLSLLDFVGVTSFGLLNVCMSYIQLNLISYL